MKETPEPEPVNPFPEGSVAFSVWESELKRTKLHERTIALLSGDLPPQTSADRDYLRDMGGVRGLRAGWPKKWVVCARCHAEWQASGFPAPLRVARYQFSFKKNRFGAWMWPEICEKCDEALHAVKVPPKPLEENKPKKRKIYDD